MFESLQQLYTPERLQKMMHVFSRRTSYLRLALQDVHDPHNISACLRSADAFGIQNVDVLGAMGHRSIEHLQSGQSERVGGRIKSSSAARGVFGWLSVRSLSGDVQTYCQQMKQNGYIIAAGYPPAQADFPLHELPVNQPIVLAFGNEHHGLGSEWETQVDYRFTIPTFGFVESLNISVSVAISLQSLRFRMDQLIPADRLSLNSEEQKRIVYEWLSKDFGTERASLLMQKLG